MLVLLVHSTIDVFVVVTIHVHSREKFSFDRSVNDLNIPTLLSMKIGACTLERVVNAQWV